MLSRTVHRVALAVGVGGAEFAAAFGPSPWPPVAYLLAGALGGVLYLQGDWRSVDGGVFPNTIIGYAGGTALSLAVAGGQLSWLLGVPPDFALWRSGIVMWDAWAGVGVALLSVYFVVGVVTAQF